MNEDASKETKVYLGIIKLKPSQLNIEVSAAQSLGEVANSFSPLETVKKEFREKTNRKLELKLNI